MVIGRVRLYFFLILVFWDFVKDEFRLLVFVRKFLLKERNKEKKIKYK